jgi:hypothetical protein
MKKIVVLRPKNDGFRLLRFKKILPRRIERNFGSVVVKEVQMYTSSIWPLQSCGEPNEFVHEIHTRMPVILPEEHHDAWLSSRSWKRDFGTVPGRPLESMANRREGELPKNNDPEIVAPIRPADYGRIGATICHTQNESQKCEKSMRLP